MEQKKEGKVWLVGTGPSDAELLTLKAKRVLEQAEVVVYDRGIRFLALGDVRQQTRTAEQIHEYRVLWILF